MGGMKEGSEGGSETVMRAFDANVSGRLSTVTFCAGFAARLDALANGFAELPLENGFEEKGLLLPAVELPPNNWLPMF
jgi:hypothetical protein